MLYAIYNGHSTYWIIYVPRIQSIQNWLSYLVVLLILLVMVVVVSVAIKQITDIWLNWFTRVPQHFRLIHCCNTMNLIVLPIFLTHSLSLSLSAPGCLTIRIRVCNHLTANIPSSLPSSYFFFSSYIPNHAESLSLMKSKRVQFDIAAYMFLVNYAVCSFIFDFVAVVVFCRLFA